MSTGNELAGADDVVTPSLRVHRNLLDDFDEWAEENHGNRSAALRELMKSAIDGEAVTHTTPRKPPEEDMLADAYRSLCHLARAKGSTKGYVRESTARRIVSGGPENIAKDETRDLILQPLVKRGYLRRVGNAVGDTSYRIHGWDDE